MKRIKSIDTIRGFCIFLMVLGHMLSWWVRPEDFWITLLLHSILGDIAAGGFLFVSGLSAVIAFKSRLSKAESSEDISMEQVNNEYLIRALLILVIAVLFNIATAIVAFNPLYIWRWFIPLTIAISLFLGFFFLKTSKLFRILLALIFWSIHYVILSFLSPYQGQINIFGLLYHALYYDIGLHPILCYFGFFLIGTVVGDVLLEMSLKNDKKERRAVLKSKFWVPALIIGPILILGGILFFFPNFLNHGNILSMIYSLGVLLTSFSILLILEEFEVIGVKKSYRFFYFYSFYSLTIYFSHYIIYFLFLDQLNIVTIWIAVIGTYSVLTLLIRFIHKKYRERASIKGQIARLTIIIVNKIQNKKKISRTTESE